MKYRNLWASSTAIGLTMVATAAFAHEKAIQRAEVPQPVIAAVLAKYPNAKLTHFAKEVEGSRTLYEVVLEAVSGHAEVSVSPEGGIVAEEATIAAQDLPEAVQEGFAASRFAKAKVLRVERVTETAKPGMTTFELMVEQAGKKQELAFDQTGKLTRVE
jgi:hypothetical protein